MTHLIALTGGPGGGKTTLLRELAADPAWQGTFLALPEAIRVAGRAGIAPETQRFQRVMVEVQFALEGALARSLDPADRRFILCHRGTLDPLAYWLDRGWPENQFYAFTGTSREDHYRRYTAVLHLVTAADGAPAHYARWPAAHRPETVAQAIRLDGLLQHVWQDHPRYYRLENAGRDWNAKAGEARDILSAFR